MHRQPRRRWVRWLTARGLDPRAVSRVIGVEESVVRADLALRCTAAARNPATPYYRRDPASCHQRPILGPTVRHIARLRELGYAPPAIASILMLDVVRVVDYLARLEPLRPGRLALTRPREPAADRAARRNQVRAEARRLERVERAQRWRGWTWADRVAAAAAERAQHDALVAAVRSGALPAAELLELAARAYAAPPRPPVEGRVVIAPATWSGDPRTSTGRAKLDPDMLAELAELRRQGWSTGALAKRYGVTRATICYALNGRTHLGVAAAPPPLFRAETPRISFPGGICTERKTP